MLRREGRVTLHDVDDLVDRNLNADLIHVDVEGLPNYFRHGYVADAHGNEACLAFARLELICD